MKRNLTVVCILTGLTVLFFAAVTVLGFVFEILPVGIVGAVMTVIALWVLAGNVYRELLHDAVIDKFDAYDYPAARAKLDKALRNHFFFPIARMIVWQLYTMVALAQDDIPAAERYASSLRHGGGEGWKYRTAYFIVLLNLDWGDVPAATAEYDSFKSACSHSSIYRSRIEVLDALIAGIQGREYTIPDGAKHSRYPIVHRIIEKYGL